MPCHDDVAQQRPVALFILPRIEVAPLRIEIEDLHIGARKPGLKTEDGRKSLHLYQLEVERAVSSAHQTEVHGHKVRVAVLPGHAILSRRCSFGSLQVRRIVDEPVSKLDTGVDHAIEQLCRKKARRLRHPELDLRARLAVEPRLQLSIFRRRETGIEVAAKRFQHP